MEPEAESKRSLGITARSPRHRRSAGVTAGRAYAPAAGTRFPSGVLGDNVRHLRRGADLTQADLAKWMHEFGFYGWSRITVANLEKGVRATSVDELFALASILNTYPVKLLDPTYSGNQGAGIDWGFPYPEDSKPEDARRLILCEDDPWRLERVPHVSMATYLKRLKSLLRVRIEDETHAS